MSITPCDYCNAEHGNLKCTNCKCAFYCSQACQKKDWKEHKKRCILSMDESVRYQAKEKEMKRYLDVLASAANRDCPICLDRICEKPLALPCQHVFCENCLVKHQKSQRVGFNCPVCRSELLYSYGLFAFLFENASFLRLMADRNPDWREYYYAEARRELTVILDNHIRLPAVFVLDAVLLCSEGKYEEAIAASQSIIEREKDPFDTVQLRNIVDAHMGLKDYREAMQYIRKVCAIANGNDGDNYIHNMNFVHHKGSECLYHLGSYQDSIEFGQMAMYVSRNRENVHKWVALSQKALGRLDEAILTMRRAVRYEAPWDAHHTQRCQELLNQLLVEREQQVQFH